MLQFVSETDRDLVMRLASGALDFAEAIRKGAKRRWMRRAVQVMERQLDAAFEAQAKAYGKVLDAVRDQWPVSESYPLSKVGRMNQILTWREAIDGGNLEGALADADDEFYEQFLKAFLQTAAAGLEAGYKNLAAEVGVKLAFDLKHPAAAAYLQAHGAEMVKEINETTRAQMRAIVSYGIENGWSYQKTAQAIQEQFKDYRTGNNWWNFDAPRPQGHIDSRAHLIAVTESGNAYEEGGFLAAGELQEAGIELEKLWSTMGDERVSEGCQENADEGWIPYEQAHASGDLHPLRFPGCRCDELYQRVGSD